MNTPSFYNPKKRVLDACEIGEALHNRIKVATSKEDDEYNIIMKKELTADDYHITPTRMILKNTLKTLNYQEKFTISI